MSLPALAGSLSDQGRVVIEALAQEKLSPEEAATILQALARQTRIVEAVEIEAALVGLMRGFVRGVA